MANVELLELLKSWWAIVAIAVGWAVFMWMLRDPKRRGFRFGSVVPLKKPTKITRYKPRRCTRRSRI